MIVYGGFVKGVQRYVDAAFGLSPAEAGEIDPQQRRLLGAAPSSSGAAAPREAAAASRIAARLDGKSEPWLT